MPLDQAAKQHAGTLFSLEVQRTSGDRQRRIQDLTNDYAQRNMLQSGGYVAALARALVQNMEELARARMNTLVTAYDRAGIVLDESAEQEILAGLQLMCAPSTIHENVRSSGGQMIRTMPNLEPAIRGQIERQCSGVFARLRLEVCALRQERALDARRVAAEAAPKAETCETSDPRTVFVVHGRDERLRQAILDFLRALDLRPLEWTQAISLTGQAAPYIGDILRVAFSHARAVVVLLTPDDEARLKPALHGTNEPDHERNLTLQARQNVLFEAGMSLAYHPDRTVLVEIGDLRPFSDVYGRHSIRLDNSVARRQDLAMRLRDAGCSVNLDGTDWHTTGDFTPPVT